MEEIKEIKKPKKEEPTKKALIKNGVTRIVNNEDVKNFLADGWSVK